MGGGVSARRLIAGIFIASSLPTTVFGVANADPNSGPPPFSLTVSPARIALPFRATSTDVPFRVTDTGTEPLHVAVLVAEFTQDIDGLLRFQPSSPLSAAGWVRVEPTSFDLRPGDVRIVHATVTVPMDPEPGERQLALTFLVPADSGDSNIRVNRAVAAQLLIGVPGAIIHKDAIERLAAPGFADGGPIRIRLNVRNLGNVHRDYTGPNRLSASVEGRTIQFPDLTVLRDSVRVVEAVWPNPPLFCICKVSVVSDDGQGHMIMVQARVIVFPARLVGGFVLVVVGLFLLTRGISRRRRRRLSAMLEEVRQEALEEGRASVAISQGPGTDPSVSERSGGRT
jgi:hypothetical protein